MFKRILAISKNYALVEIDSLISDDLLNYYVVFIDNEKKFLGEINEIDGNRVKITFLGEFIDNRFISGIIRKPSLTSNIRIINDIELNELMGTVDDKNMILGLSPLYNNHPINIDINSMFSNHSAIFGNTGSGKTYGVARIYQSLFNRNDIIPFNANIFIFNSTNEYHNSFSSINKFNINYNYKMYTTNTNNKDSLIIKLPLWHLTVDDYANLLDVYEYSQINIIEKMLSYVCTFAKNDEYSIRYKNHLIASAIISVMYTNQTAFRIRDQIFNILSTCSTNDLNLDYEIPGVGYTRTFRKCFDIDSQGEFVERLLVSKYVEQFVDNDTKWNEDYTPIYYTLEDLEVALNFTLISEGLLLNEKYYAEAIALKVKLHSIINSSYHKFFDYGRFVSLTEFITDIVVNNENKRCQIINFVLEDVDDRFAKALTKVYSRLFFKFARSLPQRGTFPMHILLEEAHRYVQNDADTRTLGYNIFERIAKEGRKYGVILDLVTQRPTELSEAVISQCSNFLIFKINHPTDLDYIGKMVPNITEDIIEKQKSLQSGICVAFGKMMKLPMIVKMELPNPPPSSANADVYDKWMFNLKGGKWTESQELDSL